MGLSQAVTVLFLFMPLCIYRPGWLYFSLSLSHLGYSPGNGLSRCTPDKKRVMVLLLTLTGLLVIAGPVLGAVSWPGFVCAVAAALGNAVFAPRRSLLDKLPVLTVSAGTTWWATLLFFLTALVTGTPPQLSPGQLKFGPVAVFGSGSVCLSPHLPPRHHRPARTGPHCHCGHHRTLFHCSVRFLSWASTFRGELLGGILIVLAVLIERSGN